MVCTLCERPAKTRGWCRLHYLRWQRHGDPSRERLTVSQRLNQRATPTSMGCLEWTGARDREGYGCVKVNGSMQRAHRLTWEATYGPIPTGLSVLHACDNPPCIRPEHLMLGSQRANVRDALAKGRRPQNRAAA